VRVHHFRPELGRFESQTVTCPALAQPLSSIHPGVNQYNTRSLRLFVSSVLLEPTTIEVSFDHPHAIASVLPGPAAAAASTWKFPYENFTADRVMVPNRHDHTPIPVSVFHRADYQFDHSAPTLLLAYGAYGSPLNPEFNPTLLSLLQRGWVVAYAHVRGGGEFGPPWHQAGKLLQKRHTFEDFLSCAEALVDRGYTQPQLLAAMGSSAGGLTVAASINQQPDLFRAAVLTVPFVDVLSPMYQPELPLTVAEYAEWGNPMTSPEIHQYIASYDPYLTIPQQPAWFPRLLVTASTLDQRVPFWIPLKYVTKLRAQLPAELRRQIILKIDESTGHGGEGGRYAGWEDQSLYVAFLLHALADSPPAVRPKI
jgi:oligopeptidase B